MAHGSLKASHIEQVIAVASDSESHETSDKSDIIHRSWARCVKQHGLDPTEARPARIIESGRLREHQEQIESFLRVARAGMEQLFKRVSSLGWPGPGTHRGLSACARRLPS